MHRRFISLVMGVAFLCSGWLMASSQAAMPPNLTVTDFKSIPGVTGGILIYSDYGLYMVNLTTGAGKYILDGKQFNGSTREVALSPDNSKMAFFDGNDYMSVLYTSTGEIERWVDAATGWTNRYLAWSPSGDKLAFVNNRDLFVINGDGTDWELFRLHRWGNYGVVSGGGGIIEHDQIRRPVWTSDGQEVIYDDFPVPYSTYGAGYISSENKAVYKRGTLDKTLLSEYAVVGRGCNNDVFVLKYEFKEPILKRINYSGSVLEDLGTLAGDEYPRSLIALSPDCRYLAFREDTTTIMDLVSRNTVTISEYLRDRNTVWSPSGNYLGFWDPTDKSFSVVNPSNGSISQVFRLPGAGSQYNTYVSAWISVDIHPADSWTEPPSIALPDRAITFVSYSDSEYEEGNDIHMQDADGTGLRKLTENGYWECWPSVSPDGEKVTYLAKPEGKYTDVQLWLMRGDGSNQMRIGGENIEIDSLPRWSPDGQKIALVGMPDDGKRGLYVINADGTGQQLLTEDLYYWPSAILSNPLDWIQFSWSPDSKSIAFGTNGDFVKIAHIDGSPQTDLLAECLNPVSDPAWSCNGDKMVFACAGNMNDTVKTMNSDGSNKRNILTDMPGAFLWRIFDPQWSYDGSKIAFIAEVGLTRAYWRDVDESYRYLYVMNSDGSDPLRLAKKVGTSFSWEPDGDWILFYGDSSPVYLVRSDGTGLTRLTAGACPVWAETGSVNEPDIAVQPSDIDLGTHPAGYSFFSSFIVRNDGGGTLSGSVSESVSWVTSLSPTSFSRTAGQQTTISFSGSFPSTPGSFSANISVTSNGGNQNVYVHGVVQGPSPVPYISPVVESPQPPDLDFWVDIQLGSAASPVNDLFGVSFVFQYTNTGIIDAVEAQVVVGGFLGSDLVYTPPIIDDSAGTVAIGVTRKLGSGGVSGYGTVARVKMGFTSGASCGDSSNLSITEIVANDPNGVLIDISAQSAIVEVSCGILVWPGDTNNDGRANQADVLPIGLHWHRTGPARMPQSTAWQAYIAQPWDPVNATYADANGSGQVDQADVLPIGMNWSREHGVSSESIASIIASTSSSLSAVVDSSQAPDTDFWVDIQVGSEVKPVSDLFGVSFVFQYANTGIIDAVEAQVVVGGFLGSDLVYIPPIIDDSAGTVAIGVTRKLGSGGVSGYGTVARVKMRFASGASCGDSSNLTFSEIIANDPNGAYIELESDPAIVQVTCDIQIELQLGWNLISLPLDPVITDPGAVLSSLGGKYNSIWAYDPDEGWSIYAPGAPSDLKEIVSGKGYWIKMDEPGTLTIQGTLPGQTAISLIGNAWNLVGYSSLESKNAEECMSSVVSDINSVWEYGPHDAAVKSWSIYAPGAPSDLEVMKPGYGYWIKAYQYCEWDINAGNSP